MPRWCYLESAECTGVLIHLTNASKKIVFEAVKKFTDDFVRLGERMKPAIVCLVAIQGDCMVVCDAQNPDVDEPWFLMCYGDCFAITNGLRSYQLVNADPRDSTNYLQAVSTLPFLKMVMSNLIDRNQFKIGHELPLDDESRDLITQAVSRFVDTE